MANIAQFQQLTTAQAAERRSLQFEGLAIWVDAMRNMVLVKDSTGVMEVSVDLKRYPVDSGQRVRIEAITEARRAHFPDIPSGTEKLRTFEKSYDGEGLDRFVSRTRGFVHPPETGEYIFWVAGDDYCDLRLSADDDPANCQVIASANDWTRLREWDKHPSQKSKKLFMEAGKRYFVEVLHLNHLGFNNFAVAWQGPRFERAVVDGQYLSPWVEKSDEKGHSGSGPIGYIFHEYWVNMPGLDPASRPSNLQALSDAPPAEEGTKILEQVQLHVIGEWAKPRAVKIMPEQIVAPGYEDFQWVEVEGEVTFSSENAFSSVLEVTKENKRLRVYVGNSREKERMRGFLGTSIVARGFCRTATDEAGNRVVSQLWVPGPTEIELRDPVAGGWAQIPSISLLQLKQTRSAMLDGQRVRLRAEVLEANENSLLLRETGTAYITSSFSPDGKNWTQVGYIAANPGPSAYVGLAVTAHDNASIAAAKFTELSGPDKHWKSTDIGNPGRSGSATPEGTGYLVKGGGADVWDGTQQFHYLHQPLTKSGTVMTRLESLSALDPWAKAGIMIRRNLTTAGEYIFTALTPQYGVTFQYRLGDRGRSAPSSEMPADVPCWLKVSWEMDENTLMVKTVSDQSSLSPGEIVEVVGVLEWVDQKPALKEAFCRLEKIPGDPSKAEEAAESDEPASTVLTTARSVQQLPVGELQKGHSARIRGVVIMKHRWGFIVQDSTAGIYIEGAYGYIDDIAVGQYVEVEGTTAPGGFSPLVRLARVKIYGPGKLPVPLHTSPRHLIVSRRDCQWVEMHGIVRGINGREMNLLVDGTAIRAQLGDLPQEESLDYLVGSNIRLRGATSAIFNEGRQLLGIELHVPSSEYIAIERAARKDPFGVPAQEIQSLAQFNAQGQLARQVKVSGTVTYAAGQTVFLQDTTGGVKLHTQAPVEFARGTTVEAVGLLEMDEFSVLLSGALVRDGGEKRQVDATRLNVGQLPGLEHDARLISVMGILVDEVKATNDQLVFQLQNGTRIFKAIVPATRVTMPLPRVGSHLELTGVCQIRKSEQALRLNVMGNLPFDIYISSQSDIRLLKAPPVWTARRIVWAAGTLAAILAVAGASLAMIWRKNILLRRTQAELLKAHEELELRVQIRTEELASANEELRSEISERKRAEAQIGQVQQQLLHASRQAGMAEIATSVLHNVGNVLNSVNVSASLVADRIRSAGHSGLNKIVSVLQEHEADLPTFLSEDPNGKRIPKLLAKLSEHQGTERARLNREMQELTKGLDHVKQIVAMQQSYARAGGVVETITPCEIVEDAIHWNAASFERHGIKLTRQFEDIPPVLVEKHKVLQILVNLLQNAKHACEDVAIAEKEITVQVSMTPEHKVRITVSDNGVGIAPDNLTRIFGHGFTTRRDGHGFGLHSGAIAAQQLGGMLTASSPGLGQGAIFTLELPLKPASSG